MTVIRRTWTLRRGFDYGDKRTDFAVNGWKKLGEGEEIVVVMLSELSVVETQLQGAVDALEDLIAAVAAPTGRLKLMKHDEARPLYDAVKQARSTLATLRGQ
jgi:hypothetical protein